MLKQSDESPRFRTGCHILEIFFHCCYEKPCESRSIRLSGWTHFHFGIMRTKSRSAQNIYADSFLIAKYTEELTFKWNTVTYDIGWYVVQPVLLYFQQFGSYSTHAIKKIFVSPEILRKSFQSAYLKKCKCWGSTFQTHLSVYWHSTLKLLFCSHLVTYCTSKEYLNSHSEYCIMLKII